MGYVQNLIVTVSLVLVPVFNANPTEIIVNDVPPQATTSPVSLVVKSKPVNTALTPSQVEIAQKVEAVFGKEMLSVVQCESNFRQFKSDGTPLKSPTSDVGVMQINQVHWERAEKLGLDIFNSIDENIIMGKIIFDEQGIEAWMAIKSECYKNLAKSG